ncbi:hypothetical protein LTR37_019470 [Vermiconidia calcicola]|uniref:Uncharacterized protein n=1 Tax=Vermiconidia calcicola TaxID=1690605 RepID=A0ACC3ME84_9PEZI|nr:hypothetical protein LTR37_019470 [Vermiconidia calcicola]
MAVIPITDLTPDTAPPADESIQGIVTLSWPYSSSTRQCAILLADRDFRLRNRKGQVRVRFTGASAEAVARSRIGIGEEVVLSLNGASWEKDPEATRTPGKSVDGELFFGKKLALRIARDTGEIDVNVDAPVSPARSPTKGSGLTTPVPKAVNGLRQTFDGTAEALPSYTYTSPAFVKRLRLSGESVLDSAYDIFNDGEVELDHAQKTKRTSFRRNLKWRYAERSPSPTKATFDGEVESPLRRSPLRDAAPEEVGLEDKAVSMLPPPLPRLHLPQEPSADQADALEQQEDPSTPKLQPVKSPTLPLPSPFPTETAQPQLPLSVPLPQAHRQHGEIPLAEAPMQIAQPNEEAERYALDEDMLHSDALADQPDTLQVLSDTEPDTEPDGEVDGVEFVRPENVVAEEDFVQRPSEKKALDGYGDAVRETVVPDVVEAERFESVAHDQAENTVAVDKVPRDEQWNREGIRPSVAEPQHGHTLPTEPKTPIKSGVRMPATDFGLDGTSSAAPSAHVTPQSEKDRVMARTYRSLFGFRASPEPPPRQGEVESPAAKAGLSEMARARLAASGVQVEQSQQPAPDVDPQEAAVEEIDTAATSDGPGILPEDGQQSATKETSREARVEAEDTVVERSSPASSAAPGSPIDRNEHLVREPATQEYQPQAEGTVEQASSPLASVALDTLEQSNDLMAEAAPREERVETKDTFVVDSSPLMSLAPDVLMQEDDYLEPVTAPTEEQIDGDDMFEKNSGAVTSTAPGFLTEQSEHPEAGAPLREDQADEADVFEDKSGLVASQSAQRPESKPGRHPETEVIELGSSSEEESAGESKAESGDESENESHSTEYRPSQASILQFQSPEIQDSLEDSETEDLTEKQPEAEGAAETFQIMDEEAWSPGDRSERSATTPELDSKQPSLQAEIPESNRFPIHTPTEAPTSASDQIIALPEIDADNIPPNSTAATTVIELGSSSPAERSSRSLAEGMHERDGLLESFIEPDKLSLSGSEKIKEEATQAEAFKDASPSETEAQFEVTSLTSDAARADKDFPAENQVQREHSAQEEASVDRLGSEMESQVEATNMGSDIQMTETVSPASKQVQPEHPATLTMQMQAPSYPILPLSPSNSQSLQEMPSQGVLDSQMHETVASVLPPTPQLTQVESFTKLPESIEEALQPSQESEVDTPAQSQDSRAEGVVPTSIRRTPARKSYGARLSNVPDVISAWFSPKRSGAVAAELDEEQQQSSSRRNALPQVNGAAHATTNERIDTELLRPSPAQVNGLSTTLSYFTPLANLEGLLNASSQQARGTSTVDVLAVVMTQTKEPTRAKGGPRDYCTIFRIGDTSVPFPGSVRVEIFRPWKATLPVAQVGDIILLRAFAAKSRKRQAFLLSTDASAWCVWRYQDQAPTLENARKPVWARNAGSEDSGAVREEIKGPPVELGEEEREQTRRLRLRWQEHVHSEDHGTREASDDADLDGNAVTAKL